jgi:hypothetical protein
LLLSYPPDIAVGTRGVFVLALSPLSAPLPNAPALAPMSPPVRPPSMQRAGGLRVYGPSDAGRRALEDFIRTVYREHYGADVRQFAPTLVGLHAEDASLVAAAGYRAADLGPLFLERYLAAPVQQMLGMADAAAATRVRIVEVGHLAALRPGAGRRLFAPLALHLVAQGFDWVVGTLTEELRTLFARLGIEPTTLGVADPAQLGADAAAWGSYYDHRPMVLAGRVGPALHRLAARAGLSRESS